MIYAELGRQTLYTFQLVLTINYWFKILTSQDTKYILVHNIMLHDVEAYPDKVDWELVDRVVFYEDWLKQEVGNFNVFSSLFKQSLTDNYVHNLNTQLQTHSRALFSNLLGPF